MTSRRMAALIAAVVFAAVSAEALLAQPSVLCIGTESGGWGGPLGWRYCYEVNLPANVTMTSLNVGSCAPGCSPGCGAADAAGNALAGWICQTGTPELHFFEKTPHGMISQGPLGTCVGGDTWAGPPIGGGPYFFGHNCTLPSHDVGWTLMTNVPPAVKENWVMPVGMGWGPVHGPVPEPMTLLALAVGAPLVLRRRRQGPRRGGRNRKNCP